MKNNTNALDIICWLLGLILLTVGIMNIFLVHPVPGIIYIIVSNVFFPPVNTVIKRRFDFSIPFSIKLIVFILIMWFTLGVGDLAEMYGL